MSQIVCTNGHAVADPIARTCPACGATTLPKDRLISYDPPVAAAVSDRPAMMSAPMAYVLISAGMAVLAGMVLVGFDAPVALGVFYVLMFVSSTLWLAGCVGLGILAAAREK